jgi:hypothetical protein
MLSLTEAHEGLTNFLAGVYKSQETEACTIAPNICDFAVWNLLYVSFCGAYNFEAVPRFFGKFVHPCLIQTLLTILLGTDRSQSAYRLSYRVR